MTTEQTTLPIDGFWPWVGRVTDDILSRDVPGGIVLLIVAVWPTSALSGHLVPRRADPAPISSGTLEKEQTMPANLYVLLRYVLAIGFGALGGALVARGILTEEQAGLLTSAPFLEAAAAFLASGAVYVFGAFFSEAAKAYAEWERFRTAIDYDPEG